VGADVAQAVYRLSGTTGIATNHPIARHLQDAMVVPQHAFLSDGTWQNAGRVLLGLDAPPVSREHLHSRPSARIPEMTDTKPRFASCSAAPCSRTSSIFPPPRSARSGRRPARC
jgi:hypothetical protein